MSDRKRLDSMTDVSSTDQSLVLDTPDPRAREINGSSSSGRERLGRDFISLGLLSRRRLTFVMLLGVTAFLCLGATAVGYNLYDRATKIDRSSPEVTVERYVYAMFGERDDAKARLLECHNKASGQGLRLLRDQVTAQEARFDIKIVISTANHRSENVGNASTVTVDLRIDVPERDGRLSRSTQRWQFFLRNDDGWRICSAVRAS